MYYLPHVFTNFSGVLEQGGYLLLGAAVLFEALPLLGSLIPGHIVIILAGFFAKLGLFNVWSVILIGIICATTGDILSFLLGRKFGYAFLQKYGKYLFLKQEHIDKAKKLIDAHTGKTVVLGKFSPITRSYVPFLVGASGVHLRTFWIYNLLGSILWVGLSVGIGYIFGASYHVAAAYFGKFIVAAIFASIIIVWTYRFVNARFHVFRKYELFVLGLNLASLWILFKMMQDGLSANSFVANFDIFTNIFVYEHALPFLTSLALTLSQLAGIEIMLALGLLIGLAYATRRKWRRAGIMILSVSLPMVIAPVLKDLFLRVRPENAFAIFEDPSFPSAHATLAAAFFMALIYVVAPSIKSWIWREAFIVFSVFSVIAIGVCRVILNVHWASDVIAGWALGIFLATSSVLVVRYVAGLILRDNK